MNDEKKVLKSGEHRQGADKAVLPEKKAETPAPKKNQTESTDVLPSADASAEETAEENTALSDSQVTAHTSSMWKYKPVPDSPEPYPEYERSEGGDDETGIHVTAARVRGKMHKHDGTNCDDWYAFDFGGGMTFAAVSDGAGSKPFSRIGSKTASETAVSEMKKRFTDYFSENPSALSSAAKPFSDAGFTAVCTALAGIMQSSVIAAAEAVRSEAEKRRNDKALSEAVGREPVLSDFSCTLLTCAVIPVIAEESGKRENLVLSVQIGDGMTATVDSAAAYSSAVSLMGVPDSGEFSGETDFITSARMLVPEEIMKRTKVQRRACTHVMMMTDGVADDYFPNLPRMAELFMDLKANGIIGGSEGAEITEVNRPYVSHIPKPEAYPWVNDNDILYSYQYTGKVCDALGITAEQLWDMPDVLNAASPYSFGIEAQGDTPCERLCLWLDNYVRRGSFDDRTLVLISIDNTI